MIRGVGKNEPILQKRSGYRSSRTPYRNDLLMHRALLRISEITSEGAASHGEENWRLGQVRDHLNKADVHLHAYLAGDRQDDHLGHFAWRAMAALEILLTQEERKPKPRRKRPGR